MYKNLNCELLGITGRQSEIIELALTYGFKGIDIDMADLMKRCQRSSFETAFRFVNSAKLNVGGFETPIDLDADEDTYTAKAALMNAVAEVAKRCDAEAAVLNVPSETDRLPYPEYFEVIRKRVEEIASIFAKEDVKVALNFSPQLSAEQAREFRFIQDVEGFVALANSCQSAGIVFDSWNWYCGNGTIDHLDSIGLDRVLAVRLGDCKEGVSPGAATLDDCLLPGATGVIDNVAYLSKFLSAQLSVPVSARGRLLEQGGTRDAFVGKTQDALNSVFEESGVSGTSKKPDELSGSESLASNTA